jgi:GT2 family glycosyltransferase
LDPVPLGANFFARREVFERCGGYDESLWQRCGKAALGCEDAELGIRWRARGVTLVYASSCTMVHRILPERSGLFHHLQWSWKTGLREELLFGAEASATYLLRRTAHHGTRALVAAAKRDPACAVHELMEGARLWARLASRTKRLLTCKSTGQDIK